MCEHPDVDAATNPGARRSGDGGFTLVELLLSVALIGVITASIALSAIVVMRSKASTEGRINNARSMIGVSNYMPTDLASAEAADTTPGAVPCGAYVGTSCPAGVDLSGSNAVQITWHGSDIDGAGNAIQTTIFVSYRVTVVDGEYRMNRVQCTTVAGATTCSSRVVLHDLPAPPMGTDFVEGTTSPSWIITVTNALAPDDTSNDASVDPGMKNKNGQRIVVTINGGGTVAGAGGGEEHVVVSAGGTERGTNLSTSDLTGAPTFTAARSRCGGNFAMVVDTSGSITSSQMAVVKTGISDFVDTFAGTPIKLEVITFAQKSSALGLQGSEWVHYFDMLSDSDISTLKSKVSSLSSGGNTNWEDGLFRVLRNSDGTVQANLPNTVIFFTDGVPTWDRTMNTSASAAAPPDPADTGLPASDGSSFFQIGWNRAERVIRDRGNTKIIGVFVGDPAKTSTWTVAGAGYRAAWFVASDIEYRRGYHVDYSVGDRMAYFRGYHMKNGSRSYTSPYSSWEASDQATFLSKNTKNDDSDGWRATPTGTSTSWTAITKSQFNAANVSAGDGDGWHTANVYSSPFDTWEPTDAATYNANNTSASVNDGWKTVLTGSGASWSEIPKATYDANNYASNDSDGWRYVSKYYAPTGPYDSWDRTTSTIKDSDTLGNLVVDNTSGVAGGFVKAVLVNGSYTNAEVANLFELPDYSKFNEALASIALGQCGGTVTMQTKIGTSSAQDPFTYQISSTNEIVKTSAAYRSGTFDVALPGGASQTVTISPQEFTDLVRYSPAGWSCKSAGQDYPFTVKPVDGHSPWTSITLTVAPNKAVSCVQQVKFT